MSLLTENAVFDALRDVPAPYGQSNIVDLGLIKGLSLKDESKGIHVSFVIEVDQKEGGDLEPLRKKAEDVVAKLPGVALVSVVLTAHKNAPPLGSKPQGSEKLKISGVKHIIAVASGKGGVGKSTTAVNLALALVRNGLRVGLLDADIYGPSIPRMLNLNEKPQVTDNKKLIPIERYGLVAMSMGFLIGEDKPMIWRGPMVHSAITQLFRDVEWGERDVILVDMPPGTGDAHLTLAQQVPLSGVIIVSTPQDIALIDARKGLNMFRRVDVPVLGIIENMSYFLCPHCGERSDIFSHGGARAEALKLEIPFLGEIPLEVAIRETSDQGEPIVASQSESAAAKNYRKIAELIWNNVLEKQKAS